MTDTLVHDNALAGAVLRMRRVGEPEAPFAGWLARLDGEVVHLVDTTRLRRWPGWQARGHHILAVHDVVRTVRDAAESGADGAETIGPTDDTVPGHEAVLAWCVERVDAFLARRDSGGAELTAGEIVTIVVSLIRGSVASRGTRLTGVWWLTHDGTPTFVCAQADGAAQADDAARLGGAAVIGGAALIGEAAEIGESAAVSYTHLTLPTKRIV